MAVLDYDNNALVGENGTGKLYIASDYDGSSTYDLGDGLNEKTTVDAIEAAFTFSDVGYFRNFEVTMGQGDERVINTDYCGVGEITRKQEDIWGFNVELSEILDMPNLGLMLNRQVLVDGTTNDQYIVDKRTSKTAPYQVFKFETCPDAAGDFDTFYFVKAVRTGDLALPFTNLKQNDPVGVSLTYEVADGGNFAIRKGNA